MRNTKLFKIAILMIAFLTIFCLASCAINNGKSAYEIAVENGYNGTQSQWLNSLQGNNGADASKITIEEIYQEAQEKGYEGSFLDFLKEYLSFNTYEDTSYATNKALLNVVSISVTHKKSGSLFFGGTYSSAGSGVIYHLDKAAGNAYIITNYHVLYDTNSNTVDGIGETIKVFLYGMEYEDYAINASYVGGSMTYDIAVLKVEGSSVLQNSAAFAAVVGDSDNVAVGQTVLAVGNPEAEGLSVTKGILSVDSEYITMKGADNLTELEFRVMRVDTGINAGNSGGGLFDARGKLLGIVSAKVVDEGVEAMGYVIPSVVATRVADKIIDNGRLNKCMLGITITSIDSKAVFDTENQTTHIEETIKIQSVAQGSLAYSVLMADDILVSVKVNDGTMMPIKRTFNVVDTVLMCNVGDKIVFSLLRNGQAQEVEITFTAESLTQVN